MPEKLKIATLSPSLNWTNFRVETNFMYNNVSLFNNRLGKISWHIRNRWLRGSDNERDELVRFTYF